MILSRKPNLVTSSEVNIITRVVPDTDFEPGYRIPGYPGFENPDSDIRLDIRRLPDTGYPVGYPVFSIGFLIFFHMHS